MVNVEAEILKATNGFDVNYDELPLIWINKRVIEYEDTIQKIQKENEFLRKRENKLQMIEQMFKNKQVDLGDLSALVEGE